MWGNIKAFFLWLFFPLLFWMIAFPYGTGGYQVELVRTQFNDGPVICSTAEDTVKADFRLDCTCTYGVCDTRNMEQTHLLEIRVYKLVDDNGERVPTKDYLISYAYDIEGNPMYIKEGTDFKLNVHLRFDEQVPSGAYTIVLHGTHSANDAVYEDLLIVP